MTVFTDDDNVWGELVELLESDVDFGMALWVAEAQELSDQVETLRKEAAGDGADLEHLDERLRWVGDRLADLKRRRRRGE